MQLRKVRKAIVAIVGVGVAFGLLDEGLAQDLTGLLTAVAVYLIPNDE
jgi:hypothetical protein